MIDQDYTLNVAIKLDLDNASNHTVMGAILAISVDTTLNTAVQLLTTSTSIVFG